MLSTYARCALAAKFHYIDGEPGLNSGSSAFGNCVHDALELYIQTRDVELAVQRFEYLWENPEVIGVKPDFYFNRTSKEGFMEKGPIMIRGFAKEFESWEDCKVLATEKAFDVKFGEHNFTGFLDLVLIRDGRLVILDFKTGTPPKLDNLHMNLQLGIYYYASLQREFWDDIVGGANYYEQFKGQERDIIWYNLRNQKEMHAGIRTDEDFKRIYVCCEQIARAVEFDVFVPTITGDTCYTCEHKQICDAYPSKYQYLDITNRKTN